MRQAFAKRPELEALRLLGIAREVPGHARGLQTNRIDILGRKPTVDHGGKPWMLGVHDEHLDVDGFRSSNQLLQDPVAVITTPHHERDPHQVTVFSGALNHLVIPWCFAEFLGSRVDQVGMNPVGVRDAAPAQQLRGPVACRQYLLDLLLQRRDPPVGLHASRLEIVLE
ncbi:MAG: hypothetical protein E6J91_49595 [Deltaproteobacteria bacterium]|nr:MAG: hypothetical protein E6J91_49595 [Deltaproteobacteria bacterium]